MSRVNLIAIATASLVVAAAFSVRPTRLGAPANVVVITLDTTRADRLSPYGYMNVNLPHLERLAREGVVFDQATSVAPLTLPAHSSLFTGLLPPRHGVRDNADQALAERHTTLAEVLRGKGFRTGAFVGSVVLDPDRGLRQGFDEYRGVRATGDPGGSLTQRPGNEVIDDAIAWLETGGGDRFFLWAHLYDPHRPYAAPRPYGDTYAHNPYLGEIAYVDAQIGRLLDALEQRNLLGETLVIVTADHGESLGEHRERDHGIFVYESVLRVPLIVRWPGLAPARIGEVVRLTDIMPTALQLLDVPAPAVDGASLAGLLTGANRDLNLEAYAESKYPERLGWSSLFALRDRRYKLIAAPKPELYDLQDDPFETRNIHAAHPDVVRGLSERLAAITAQRGATDVVPSPGAVTDDLRRQLAALGYVGGGPVRPMATREALPDPKDCMTGSGLRPWLTRASRCGALPESMPARPAR